MQVDKKNYDVVIDLISGRDGKGIGQSRERCELCGIKEVGTQMDRQVLSLRGKAEEAAATAPGRFSIESRPQGAEVTIDGKAAGVTPLSVDVASGTHRMTVRADGFQLSEQNIFVDSGMNGYLAVDLAPTGTVAAVIGGWRPSRLTARGAWSWSARRRWARRRGHLRTSTTRAGPLRRPRGPTAAPWRSARADRAGGGDPLRRRWPAARLGRGDVLPGPQRRARGAGTTADAASPAVEPPPSGLSRAPDPAGGSSPAG